MMSRKGNWKKMMQTNLFSAYHLTRALLPGMMLRRSGSIVNICSIASLHAYEGGGGYSISKFAMHGFNQNLRHEMKKHGIRVIGVYPGAVMTDSWAVSTTVRAGSWEASDGQHGLGGHSVKCAGSCGRYRHAPAVGRSIINSLL